MKLVNAAAIAENYIKYKANSTVFSQEYQFWQTRI